MTPRVILITGNMASGKSTIGQALAERIPKSVHLRGDLFRKMIVNGRAEMTFELSEDAKAQLRLRHELATEVARRYVDAGFVVVYQDILIGHLLREAVNRFDGVPVSVVVLAPEPAAVAAREAGRSKSGYRSTGEIEAFDRVLRDETEPLGLWLDTTNLSVRQTVDQILEVLERPS